MSNRMLAIIFLAGIAAPISQFKVPPMLRQIMLEMDISLATSGWLMSVFALTGVIFALPAGQIIQRIGLKFAGVTALVAILVGSLMGVLSNNIYILLFSRAIEGVGLTLTAITGPASIAAWFPSEKRGKAMGIWATWVPLGTIIAYMSATVVDTWKYLWIVVVIYTFVVLIVYVIWFKIPDTHPRVAQYAPYSVYKNKNIWLLATVFMLFNLVSIAVKSYMPLFLEKERGIANDSASMITSIIMVFSLIAGPLAGLIADKLKAPRKMLSVAILVQVLVVSVLFKANLSMIFMLLVFQGIMSGVIPTVSFSLVSELMKSNTGIGMSVLSFGQNAGMCLGPVVSSYLAGYLSWQAAGITLALMLLVAVFVSRFIKV